ncbi:hypothetical protein [Adhaeribacter rhizoryzae]|uniref:Uncharacterized protein n=1 Tax=Adhaeribacter rhizoryzae TaxID=2607907 RepID=A0A5M6DJ69_9BACT|nr:hypothetical protein [Adhaeribacter rhizoryzae]KAA5547531.1 hypothetical protein F0145_09445 [Adhaeribacter rhizoryzae]
METPIYQSAAILFTFLTVIVAALIILALHYALAKTDWPERKKKNAFWTSTAGLVAWLALLALLANQNFFSDFSTMPPRFVLAIAPPWIVIAWLASRKSFRYLLSLVPPAWPVYLQSFRVVVEIGLWMALVAGVCPVQMTFEGRNFDILVGLTAPLAGYFFFQEKLNFRWGLLWNIFGLALLLNIVTVAILSTPTPFRVFLNEPANTFVTVAPFIWLPGFLVPVALAMHVFSLLQIFNWQKESAPIASKEKLQKVAQ